MKDFLLPYLPNKTIRKVHLKAKPRKKTYSLETIKKKLRSDRWGIQLKALFLPSFWKESFLLLVWMCCYSLLPHRDWPHTGLYRCRFPDFSCLAKFYKPDKKINLLLYTIAIWYRNMPSDQIKFSLGWKEIQFSKHSTSLRKRRANYKIMIPQTHLYLCRGNCKCKIETFSINTN